MHIVLIYCAILTFNAHLLLVQALPEVPRVGALDTAAGEGKRQSTLGAGRRIAEDFDRAGTSLDGQSSFLLLIEPHLNWKISRPRWESTVDYKFGTTLGRQKV